MFKKKDGWNPYKINIAKEEKTPEKTDLSESYNNFILHFKDPKEAIKKDIKKIKSCKTPPYERDFLWLFFLGIIPFKNPYSWQRIITEERAQYLDLKKKYLTKDIEDFMKIKRINDINKYDEYKTILPQEDFKLLNLIKVDVERTYQENEIFKKEEIKNILINVLFVYGKENPKYNYKQGMNDICGVFLYILYKNYTVDDDFGKDTMACIYSIFHSNNIFLEHDLFILYNKFMNKGIAEFFLCNSEIYKNSFLNTKTIEEKRKLTVKDIYESDDSDLKKRIYILYYKKFNEIDLEYSEPFINNIEPEIFLVKWYLCVFTREFNLEQIVYLWDLIIMYEYVENKIYANKKLLFHFNFMDCIALSMLLNCKPDLIKKGDINELMFTVMHYPASISIEHIVKVALDIYSKMNPEIII
jgi:TBC1 domain family protein 5